MQSIDEFLDRWTAAERRGDATALDELLTDDFVGVGPLGFTLPKPAWLARYDSGTLSYDAFELEEIQTRTHGDCAVVTARQNQRGTAHGEPVLEAARVTLSLTDDDGRWRLAGAHLSFIAGTTGSPPLRQP